MTSFKVTSIGSHDIHPWRKYRIGIHSDICIRTNANHFELIQKTFCNSFFFNPRQQSEWIRTNPKPSFQTESIRMNSRSEWFGLILIENSVWINPSLDWPDWKLGFELVRIHSNCCLGLNRIRSDRFFTIFHQMSYKTFFGLVRNDSHWLGYRYRNESE